MINVDSYVSIVMSAATAFMPFTFASNVHDVWYGALGTLMAQAISQLFDVDGN